MPLEIVRNDVTRMEVDAIVNAANETLLGGGGVDGAIHRAAGPELLAECRTLSGCPTGEAKITRGYRLPCRYVIHTVGPIWRGGRHGEEQLLTACYRNSLALAKQHECQSVAFPLISSGVYGYPKEQALKVATDAIRDFLMENDMLVYIVLFDRDSFHASGRLYARVAEYIDDNYVDAHQDSVLERSRRMYQAERMEELRSLEAPCAAKPVCASGLEGALQMLDESFSQMVLRKIDEAGIKDSVCYKRANLDRKLFSKIRNNANYHPTKRTALALAVALELDIDETAELLQKAGLALSHSYKFDVIVEYCILNGIYDVNTINQTLFDFDQPLLGA